jgi:methylthioribose-1-phosphate isomerase
MSTLPSSVRWDGAGPALVVLDQTLLPGQEVFLTLGDTDGVIEAIKSLRVRGAPAIGLAAAWGLVLALHRSAGDRKRDLEPAFAAWRDKLLASRPTAVNLRWALERLAAVFALVEPSASKDAVLDTLTSEASRLQSDDEAVCLQLGEHGLSLLKPGAGVLTHCNAGAIATARWGTALAPLHLGQERGYGFRVWVDETRPLLQGARLTAWELGRSGVDATLICDNMAASVMAAGKVDAVVVGCDRVAANGDVANKIGTLGLAVLAHHFGIPFYVFAPTSTIDVTTPDGAAIPIEERKASEVTSLFGSAPTAPAGTKVFNPAFDVTPAALVTALVTEKGILRPPYGPALAEVSHG